ncbi:hypothetical protein FACS189490_02020 [Clostridia bacterium]|nr:hypothetical protein FACS189490_02020 [Clostridia bacterium]
MGETINIGLVTYGENDGTKLVREFISELAGDAPDSNMSKIDTAVGDDRTRLTTLETGKADKSEVAAAQTAAVTAANAYTDEQISDTVAASQTWLPSVSIMDDLPTVTDTTKTYLCRVTSTNNVYQCVAGQTEWALYSSNTDYIDETELADTLTGYVAKTQTVSATGDITASATALSGANTAITATINSGAVTNAKMADMAALTFKGATAAGAPVDLTVAQAKANLAIVPTDIGIVQGTATLTNTLAYPFNNSLATVSISPAKASDGYTVLTEYGGANSVGNVSITNKLLNGFQIEFDGSATGVTVNYTIIGGN